MYKALRERTGVLLPALPQVCRCVPFIHRAMQLQELVTVREIRAIIKEKFLQHKDVTDPRVCCQLLCCVLLLPSLPATPLLCATAPAHHTRPAAQFAHL